MLIEFRVENHRSIGDEQALTMRAGRVGDPEDSRPREITGYKQRVLPAAALYGANASGKSNLLAALGFLHSAVILSQRFWPPNGGVPRDPFAWGPRRSEPSLFEVTFVKEDVRYQYGFVANDERFLEEWLYAWPGGRRQTWFTRDGDTFKVGENLRGGNRLIEQVPRTNALFLSTAAQAGHEQLASIYQWFHANRMVNVGGLSPERLSDRWLEELLWSRGESIQQPSLFSIQQTSLFPFLSDSHRLLIEVRDVLQAADVGIVDITVEPPVDGRRAAKRPRPRLMVRHRSAARDAFLPVSEESHGTQTVLRMAPLLLDALHGGHLLVIDELEASLHPLLALQIVKQFNDPRSNPRNAQLLFTTHDTNLLGTELGEPALRRDQIWLTEKDKEGATCVYPLTDYKPRKAENLERGYLQGRYGAIPFLGALARLEE